MTERIVEALPVTWAFVVGVDWLGQPHFIDHDESTDVTAKRVATLDDIYAASSIASEFPVYERTEAGHATYTCAFLVFQLPEGIIAASPNIFDNVVPMDYPSGNHMKGAFNVLQAQIIAQKTAEIAAPMAVQATLSVLGAGAKAQAKAEGKSEGGLLVA
jgi:hypothetical protein